MGWVLGIVEKSATLPHKHTRLAPGEHHFQWSARCVNFRRTVNCVAGPYILLYFRLRASAVD